MDQHELLADQFEANRSHLKAVAYRMLGSLSEAEDAVQEAWLRLSRSVSKEIDNLGGWLTTVVARVCLDVLRSRKSRQEESLAALPQEPAGPTGDATDPEAEAILANSVGLALLVVLDTLPPAERLAFVLHDMFDLSFDEIAPVIGRSPVAARQLASRARRRVRGAGAAPRPDITRKRRVVDAFLTAARGGDFNALLDLLDPDAVLRSDPSVLPPGVPSELHGAEAIAGRAIQVGARAAQTALVDGDVGVIVAPRGRLLLVVRCTVVGEKIVAMETIAAPERLHAIDLAVFSD
jgi:RNA polymerase sigma-70 factor (ECF subfamily)